MLFYITKRLIQALFVVFVVTLLVAWAIRLSGDPAVMLAGAGNLSPQDLENIRQALGLNQPFWVQYGQFILGLLHGQFGFSFVGHRSVGHMIAQALPATLELAVSSLVLSIVIALPMGMLAAIYRGGKLDQIIRVISLIGLSFPNFWLALLLVLFFSITLGWLPPSGADSGVGLILPSLTMAIILSAINVRLVRTTMLETLNSQYILVARGKGLSEWQVLFKHALRNAAIPLVTYLGLQFGSLVGGIVVIEQVFSWPGMGSLAFNAISNRDYAVLQGAVTVLALLVIGVNLAVDLLYGLIDPRIRHDN
ncbi:ABC transporter permease [Celerinatantimonas diazotrophica]|uniref:Peptide/nickel transport system permease protein n=1 Tax=Celerinatantimonas diazotrophica TaxID=412034 RepID=A0A4R1KAN3_9GAMM|nr:ABC transporter permease [Celerinatantimonas diazotrophica]TCK61485.1 peptide/nickel transport system permease protein [Celerinatantimonas diazotrophica]CAG9296948.1 Glutathione transport system permease protein GsiC [Celerinatantimonas diazotrophica]